MRRTGMTAARAASMIALAAMTAAAPLAAQVPADAASDRRLGDYVHFQSFGEPDLPFENLESAAQVRARSSDYFVTELATCQIAKDTCDADNVYELADRFCQALEFHEAASWRVSNDGEKLVLHWAVCGFKK